MRLDASIYDFIANYAYFACSANIVIENLSMEDEYDFYKRIADVFVEYLRLYETLQKTVRAGNLKPEAAEAMLKSSVRRLHMESVKRFSAIINPKIESIKNKLDRQSTDNIHLGTSIVDSIYLDSRVYQLKQKAETNDFTSDDLQSFLEDMRCIEEQLPLE